MALRDKLRERAQPFLEPGERIEQVFIAQATSPWWVIPLVLIAIVPGLLLYYALVFKPVVVAVTDRAIVVLGASHWTMKPRSILTRLPRATRIGPVSGIQARVELNGHHYWIHRRFHRDVNTADAAVAS